MTSPAGADSASRQQVRGSTLLVVGRLVSLLFTLATQVLIVRMLTKAEYGGFAYALALAAAGRTLLSLGVGKTLSRFLAMYEEQKDYQRLFGSIALTAITIGVTSTAMIVALFLAQDTLVGTALDDPTAVDLLLILAFLAPLEALDQVFVSLFAVFSRPRAIFFRKYVFTPGLRLGVVVVMWLTDAGVTVLAIGYLATGVVGLAVYVTLLVTVLRQRGLLQHLRPRQLQMPVRAVYGFSVPLLTGELVYLSMNTGSVVLLGWFWGVEQVAEYRAVVPAATLNKIVFSSFVTLFLPMAARLFARGDTAGMRRSYWHTSVFLAVGTFPVFAMTGPFAAATTTTLFGDRYAEAATVLAILSLGYYLSVALGFNTYTLQVCGRIRFLVVTNVLVAITSLALSFALVPSLGAVGVAVAHCTTLVMQNIINQLALRATIGTALIDRDHLLPFTVIAVAGAALWLFGMLLTPGIMLSMGTTALASVAVLLLTRRHMHLAETFPELLRVPVLRALLR